ncbi:hypothetical protein [Parasphingorhabdus pacifica]
MTGPLSWLWPQKPDPQWSTGGGPKGDRRRRELTCGEHKPSSGEQITGMTVRWTCECGAYRDEIDAAPPHGHEIPTPEYLEMERKGLKGKTGPWRSQVTGKPLLVKRTTELAESYAHQLLN